jgi:hypothetical protein
MKIRDILNENIKSKIDLLRKQIKSELRSLGFRPIRIIWDDYTRILKVKIDKTAHDLALIEPNLIKLSGITSIGKPIISMVDVEFHIKLDKSLWNLTYDRY